MNASQTLKIIDIELNLVPSLQKSEKNILL